MKVPGRYWIEGLDVLGVWSPVERGFGLPIGEKHQYPDDAEAELARVSDEETGLAPIVEGDVLLRIRCEIPAYRKVEGKDKLQRYSPLYVNRAQPHSEERICETTGRPLLGKHFVRSAMSYPAEALDEGYDEDELEDFGEPTDYEEALEA